MALARNRQWRAQSNAGAFEGDIRGSMPGMAAAMATVVDAPIQAGFHEAESSVSPAYSSMAQSITIGALQMSILNDNEHYQ